ncbi:MAG TPA: ATP-binding protein [Candidatus Saccharimonadales bacterium]|nr:ATP-binding protein [Candidatus Saccharimonadales bacterium]
MLVAATILALYFWAFFADVESVNAALLVSDTVAIMAGGALAVGFISYLWAPKKYVFWGSLIAFIVLSVMTATLILNTGGSASPFIALWMIVAVFAGVFGVYGLLPLFIAVTAYMVLLFTDGSLTRETIIAIVLAGELPLIVSYLIWHTNATNDNSNDRAYRDLASELSQVANKAEVVINAIGDGVIALNSQGVIQLINPAAQQIIGWGKQDALALNYKSVLKLVDKKGEELTASNDPVSATLATNKQVTTNDLSLLTNSEKKILVSVIVSPVGQLGAGAIIVFRDITNEKSEERAQAEFISTASHEMRTPVASIEGYLGLALNPATATVDIRARDFINKAHESAQHLGRLFQDLLDVTKAEDGRLSNNPKVVDLVMFTHDIMQGLESHAKEKGLRMLFKPLPDGEQTNERRLNPVFYVNVDNDHLREVIGNLVENAIKYTPKGDVTVDITGDNDHVTISVADSGIGIPKEDQAHLFQKFYRVDNTATREIGGTGLGLYLCRRLTETMNGRIWAESEYKQGSTFYVELARTSHEDAMRLIEEASMHQEDQMSSATQVYTSDNPVQEPPAPLPQNLATAAPQPQQPEYATPQQQAPAEPPIPATTATTPPQVAPQPQPPATQNQTPPAVPAASRAQPNTPLSAIEQNPNQYIQGRENNTTRPPQN